MTSIIPNSSAAIILFTGHAAAKPPERPALLYGDLWNLPEPLAPLTKRPQWVCWRWRLKTAPKGSRWTKVPYQPNKPADLLAKTSDPTTWGTYEKTLDVYEASQCDGIGFVLNGDIAAFDIDDCRDKATGGIAPEAMKIVTRCASYTEITVSGTGLRIIGVGDGSITHRQQRIPYSNVKVESYSNTNRYIVITGNALPEAAMHLADIGPMIKAIVQELDAPPDDNVLKFEKPTSRGKIPDDLLGLISNPPGTDLSSEFHHAVNWLGDLGYGPEETERHITGQPIVPARYSKRIRQEIERCLHKATPKQQNAMTGGVTLDDFHAYMPMHQYIFAPTREMWPASSVNQRISVPDDPKTTASQWLDRNKPVEQMTWAPGEPMIISGRLIADGGWIRRSGVSCFNLYRPPVIINGNAANAGLWIDHVRKVYGEDADHIVNWCAHRVQRPREKINHALFLGGEQGIGKDTLLEPVKEAVGPWNFIEAKPQQVLGRFNSYVKSVILRISEARDLGDIDRFKFYDHMKGYITAPPDVHRVDEKHLREHNVLNVCGVVITSNYKTDGIYLPADDRRHFVAWSDLTKDDFPPDYWNKLYGWYRNGGTADVAAHLATLDISSFDPKAPPPKTRAFWQIVDANQASENAELADALDAMGNPDAFTLNELKMSAKSQELAEWLGDRKNRRSIPHRVEEEGYEPVRNPDAKDGLWKINGRRQAIYAKKGLSARDRMAAAQELSRSV
jgi:Family of unknown function (DUF5906)